MKRVYDDYNKLKKIAKRYVHQNNYERALETIFFACGFMYTMNQIYQDDVLEEMVKVIAKKSMRVQKIEKNDCQTVLYYDSFGNVNRGLTKIYLEAIKSLGYKIIYITFKKYQGVLDDLLRYTQQENIYFVEGKKLLDQMQFLVNIIAGTGAAHVLLYMTPDDVTAVGAFSLFEDRTRYQINLTDHAFWLGSSISDVVINFREFGAKVCKTLRGIPEEKLVYLPYYPCEVESMFQGLPFGQKKFIFSGGSLYKTESIDNQYYKLIDKILSRNTEIYFIYLGNGDARKILQLKRKYSDRVIFDTERMDFYEIMKRCTLYLSTYPYNGGLMTQYSLLAGKLPITLICQDIEAELTIHHDETIWNFDNIEQCYNEIEKLIKDDVYREKREKDLQRFLVDKEQFTKELQHILLKQKAQREVEYEIPNAKGFSRIPLENYSGLKYDRLFFRQKGLFMVYFFPIKYTLGMIEMIHEKFYKK